MPRLLGFTKVAEVKPKELIYAYVDEIRPYFIPALKLTLGIGASVEECETLKTLEDRNECKYAFLLAKGRMLKLMQGLDGKALVQLLAPMTSQCRLALMLYALVNGNIELAEKHVLWGSEEFPGLVGRLFGDVYGVCYDVSSEGLSWRF
jgi:hypothetical protein